MAVASRGLEQEVKPPPAQAGVAQPGEVVFDSRLPEGLKAPEEVLMVEPTSAYEFGDWLQALRRRGITLDHVFPPAGGLLVLRGETAAEASAKMPPGTVVHAMSPEGFDEERLKATLEGRIMWSVHRALLGLECVGPSPDAGGGRPLIDDALEPPVELHPPESTCNANDLYRSTSEYMLGSVSVTVILPESACVLGCENWDIFGVQELAISTEIAEGLNDLRSYYLGFGLSSSLAPSWTYHYIFGRTDARAQISAEPIWGPGPTYSDPQWLPELYGNLGYGSPSWWEGAKRLNADQRASDGTDWAYTIFVVNSFWDLDGMFSNGKFAYAYRGGPFVVMTDDNDGWTIFNMNKVTRHESSHIFYALDEYTSSGCTCTEAAGYVSTPNQNCHASCASDVDCIMNESARQAGVCTYTRGQIGWGDSDGDHIPDPVDILPQTSLTPYSPDPTTNTTLTFTGSGAIQKRTNQNGLNYQCDINVLNLSNVQWRVDGGGWASATPSDGSFNGQTEAFTFTATVSSGAVHTFQARAVDELGQTDSTYASDTVTVCNPISVAPSSLAAGTEGTPYSVTFTQTGGTGGVAWSRTGSLPPGMGLSAGGVLSGTPAQSGTYGFTVVATDSLGCQGSRGYSLTITNVAPQLQHVNVSSPVSENGTATLSGDIVDPGTLDTFTLTVNWGDPLSPGNVQTFTYGASASGSQGFTLTHQYLDDNPTGTPSDGYAIALTVADSDGATGTASPSVTIDNVAPVLSGLNVTSPIDENGTATLTGSIGDPGTLDTFTLAVTWGDGSPVSLYSYPAGTASFSETHQYLDDNPTGTPSDNYAINVVLNDDDSGSDSGAAAVTVNNLAPFALSLSMAGFLQDLPTTMNGSFFDPGSLDTFTIAVDWGDGTPPSAMNLGAGVFTFNDSHVYTETGGFTVTVTVTDDDTGAITVAENVWIYDVNFEDDGAPVIFCADLHSGQYAWGVPGESPPAYFGRAEVINAGAYLWNGPADPNFLYVVYDPVRLRAYGYFFDTSAMKFFSFYDSDTMNNEGLCPGGGARPE